MRGWLRPLPDMIETFKKSGKIACFIAVHPPFTFHLAELDQHGSVVGFRTSEQSDTWINGGYFIFRKEIFDFISEGQELVNQPFGRLIKAGELMAYRYEGVWRAMDTMRDRQLLEDMVEKGNTRRAEPPREVASIRAARRLDRATPRSESGTMVRKKVKQ
jgi:glucose-1-phosphate cytidylyltransferase